jgi:hypothetical protein
MAVTESFLVNTNSFNAIIEALIELDEAPEEVTDELLVSLGFESPSDLLVVHMLKELKMVTMDGKPTDLYHQMINPETTDEAVATGIIHAYEDLFEKNRDFHKLQKEDIHKEMNEYFDGRKTDLIIKYMTNTFHKLVAFSGLNNVQKAVDTHFKDAPVKEEDPVEEQVSIEEEITLSENGSADSQEFEEDLSETDPKEESEFDDIFFTDEDDDENEEKASKKSINFDELPRVHQEEKGSKNIDDFFVTESDEEENKELENLAEETDSDISEKNIESEENSNQDESNEADSDDEFENIVEIEDIEEGQESLEQELLEINMESTNGHNTNGAETKENPMANLTNIPTTEKVEKALIKKAELLYKLERFEDVLPAYNEVISFFDDSDKDHLKEAVAKAVINRVAVLNKLDREDDLLPALDEVIDRFEHSSTTEYYEQASMAMLQKSQLLEDESPEVLLSLYNDIIDRLKNASSPKIKNQVDDIFISKVDILGENGSDNELLDAVDDLIERFEDSKLHTGQLEQAMYKKAEILENLNRDEEALEAYSEFLEKFGKTEEAV